MKRMKEIKVNAIVIAIVLCGLGTTFVIAPGVSARTICYALAAILGVIGLIYIIRFLKALKDPEYVGNDMGVGVCIACVGAFMALQVESFLKVIPIMLGFLIIFDSVIKMQNSFYLKRVKSEKWGPILLLGLANFVVGVLLLMNPFFQAMSSWIIALGVGLIFSGVSDLVMLIIVIKASKSDKEDTMIQKKIEKKAD